VKRALDRRPVVFLARRGAGTDHPTAAANLALIEVAAAKPGARILNCADPDAPSGLEISRAVARHLRYERDEVLLEGNELGRHPWDTLPSIVLDMTAASDLGYVPVGNYVATVAEEIDWLVAERPPLDEEFFASYFDYSAEDRYLAAIGRPTTSASRSSGSTSK
jgi:hypothetical protein